MSKPSPNSKKSSVDKNAASSDSDAEKKVQESSVGEDVTNEPIIVPNIEVNILSAMSDKSEVKIVMDDATEPLAAGDMDTVDLNNNGTTDKCQKPSSEMKNKQIKEPVFRDKEFKVRPSLLTILYETDSRVVCNFCIALFFLFVSGLWVKDYFETGNPLNHFELLIYNFAQLPSTACCWLVMFAATVVFAYYGLTLWSRLPSEKISTFSKIGLAFAYACYIFSMFYYPLKFVYYWGLSPACSFIITCENTRLSMKAHSFIRENFDRAIRRKKHLALSNEKSLPIDGTSTVEWPTIQQFMYYFFCPSFLYRDSYPRAEKRCWGLVAQYAFQCFATIYLLNASFILVVQPVFGSMTYEKGVPFGTLAFSMFLSMIPGALSLFAIFYGLLHSWMNMFAEAMRFGDRSFYANWWHSKNMAEYYRKWNLIVHEWLYVYIYRDFTLILGKKWGPKISQICVFFFSSAFHEYWFGVSLRVFYPVIFFMYFICGGVFFIFAGQMTRPQLANTIMWFNLFFGTAVFYASYAPEYYARQRCPKVIENNITDLIVPRIWSCIKAQ